MISTGVNARAFSRGVLSLDHIIARERLTGPISRQLHLPVHMTHTPESQLATGQVEFEHAAETLVAKSSEMGLDVYAIPAGVRSDEAGIPVTT